MRRMLVAFVALVALAVPTAAAAHPLGNFTVNRFSAVQLSGESVFVHYVLDLAEIPTYQDGGEVRAPGFAKGVARRLVLQVDGRRVGLVSLQHELSTKPGAGGLPTLRFEAVFRAVGEPEHPSSTSSLVFHDTNFADRIGWREIVVRSDHGAAVRASSAPAESTSDELRAYPKDLLRSPLDVASARVTYVPGSGAGVAPGLDGGTAPTRSRGGFESLVARGSLSFGVVLVSLLIAAFWGAAHALTPGHGKAIVAGYLVGSRGKPRHAVMLGVIVTVTHTAGVFGLGLVTLLLSRFIVPERLYPWLTFASGLLVVAVGASVFWRRWRHRRTHTHGHAHSHEHHHDTRGLVGIGVAAGLLPCPSALVVLLSAIALHRIGFGLALILAFSLGLAATITGIGLVAVLARRTFGRLSFEGRLIQALPALSALVILAIGIGLTLKSLPEVI